jgi:mRNA-degrading endonuclease RelE of RelBE toxin-antitoxin system
MFTIEYASGVAEDLSDFRTGDRKLLLDRIEQHLAHEPTKATRNRKIILGLKPPWEYEEPIWELRVGQFRVFYDVDDKTRMVVVLAIRFKPPHKTTEEIL